MVAAAHEIADDELASPVSESLEPVEWQTGRVSVPAPRPVRAKIGGAIWVLAGAEVVGLALVFGGDGAPRPLTEVLRLASAAAVGFAVRAVCARWSSGGPSSRSAGCECVGLSLAGALMALLIENPVALALGAAGAAGVALFRLPLSGPKEAAAALLVFGLGLACGAGAISAAALGALILVLVLALLSSRRSPAGA
jgi:hypothetical protein